MVSTFYYDLNISIHALRGEGDTTIRHINARLKISIHALRGEGDLYKLVSVLLQLYFNPRPPWGGRRGNEGAQGER